MSMFHTEEELPFWLHGISIIMGAEGDDDGGAGSSGDDSSADDASGDAGSDDDDSDDSPGSGDDDSHDDDSPTDDLKELKEALAKERKANKQREKELNRLKRQQREAEDAKKGETEAAKAKAERLEKQLKTLSAGYLKSALDRAIEEAARKANFVDTKDAVQGVDRNDLVFEQDDEDPSDIDIDTKSVEKAVKQLAARKPHWIRSGTDDGEPSGSTFGGAGRRNKGKKAEEESLRQKYPALNH